MIDRQTSVIGDAERQLALLQQMPGFVAVLNGPAHVFDYVNDAYVAISGPRDFLGRSVREVFPELAGQGFPELLDAAYATGEPFSGKAMPVRLGDEEDCRYIDFLYQPIRDDQGVVTGIFVGGYDVTERVRGQNYRDAMIRLTDRIADLTDPDEIGYAAAEVLGEMLRVSRVGYGTIDPVTETLHVERDWNAPGVETLAGVVPLRDYGSFIDSLKRGEFISIGNVDLDDRTAAAADALKGRAAHSFMNVPVIEQGRLVAVLYVNHGAVRAWTPEEHGLLREAAARTRSAVERSRNDAALRRLNDSLQERIDKALRDQRSTEEALRQAQKMEAVGQLTGGLAHDFNNLLTGMMGNIELLQRRLEQGRLDGLERFIVAAQGAGKRAAALTHRLLAFSRRQTLDPRPIDINRLIAGMEDMLRRSVGPGNMIEVIAQPEPWVVNIDASQLENALLNLCINARDAMPDGGQITIRTANIWLEGEAAGERDLAPGPYLSLSVIDTGTGMDAETIKRAFEPFFTTKPLGEGTGLGLSMIYGFARQSNGRVHIASELGKGTAISIYLPRHAGEMRLAEDETTTEPVTEGTGETVLVVDDETTIRHLIDEVLDDRGYTVIGAADGAAALKILQSGVPIDLLITDVGLPNGLNGRQIADAARASRPGLKVLFITGYAEGVAVGNGRLDPGMEVLTKPFTMEDLTLKVSALLEER